MGDFIRSLFHFCLTSAICFVVGVVLFEDVSCKFGEYVESVMCGVLLVASLKICVV